MLSTTPPMKFFSTIPRTTKLLVGLASGTLAILVAARASESAAPDQAAQTAASPKEVQAHLAAGNARYVAGKSLSRDWSAERAKTAKAQYPVAVVLSCIDSRVSSEVIFDQGFGELFNARVAGNVIDDDLLGSMEFACKLAGAKLIAVVGHSQCGAVKGACNGVELGHLTGLLEKIQPAVAQARAKEPALRPNDEKFIASVAELNVRHTMAQIRERSPVLRELIDSGQVGLIGGIYELDSGKVTFLQN